MKKTGVILAALLLTGFFMMPAACADYGYTSVDSIPMAVDFTIKVEVDEAGLSRIVTDYPFEETGATEMNISFSIDGNAAFDLKYNPGTKSTTLGGYYSDILGPNPGEAAFRAIRNGDAVMEDQVCIGTSRFSAETDWFLYYSLRGQSYTRYEERTRAQSFDGMGPGGVGKSIFFTSGQMTSSSVLVRSDDADLVITFSRSGDIETGDITVYHPQNAWYTLDTSTGLFNGHTLTDLGFKESDLEIEPLAAVGEKVSTVVAVQKDVPAAAADRSAFSLTGGLLSGIMIGLMLYILLRRKKKALAETAAAEASGKKDEKADSDAALAPGETFDSAPKAFSAGK